MRYAGRYIEVLQQTHCTRPIFPFVWFIHDFQPGKNHIVQAMSLRTLLVKFYNSRNPNRSSPSVRQWLRALGNVTHAGRPSIQACQSRLFLKNMETASWQMVDNSAAVNWFTHLTCLTRHDKLLFIVYPNFFFLFVFLRLSFEFLNWWLLIWIFLILPLCFTKRSNDSDLCLGKIELYK